jgi:hypothetical protein
MVMKFEMPNQLFRIVLDLAGEEVDNVCYNIIIMLNDEFISWAEQHNITDYEVEVDNQLASTKYYINFASDASGMMYRLSWGDAD